VLLEIILVVLPAVMVIEEGIYVLELVWDFGGVLAALWSWSRLSASF
jgi:hypothetical protein